VDRERVLLQLRVVQVVIDGERKHGGPTAELVRKSSKIVEAAVEGMDVSADPAVTELLASVRAQLANLEGR
jgi:hypothetical protein